MAQQQTVGKHKTSIFTIDESVNGKNKPYTHVNYVNTSVVKFSPDEIILNSGGWRTSTTKSRMNQASNQFGLGYQVYQKNFDWFVDYDGQTIPFTDNMSIKRY